MNDNEYSTKSSCGRYAVLKPIPNKRPTSTFQIYYDEVTHSNPGLNELERYRDHLLKILANLVVKAG